MMQMASGVFIPSLGCSLLVQQRGEMVCRVYFVRKIPSEPSPLAEEIVAYLEGKAPCPKAELDMSGCTDFKKQIYGLVQSIPRGATATYGQVAEGAKRPGAARAVGSVMAANPFAILVPCHRVVARDGPGGYRWGREMKEKLLVMEREGHQQESDGNLVRLPGH
jgi:methylated-DNA-[protein]-cysteine S-methyltransferase